MTVIGRQRTRKNSCVGLRGIILFEAAAREIKKAGLSKFPSAEKPKAELDGFPARKAALQAEHQKIQWEEKKYDTLRQNVDAILLGLKDQDYQRTHELE